LRDNVVAAENMDPVDRALMHADQRQSFVRGHNPSAAFDDPLSVLAAEVRRLRVLLGVG